MSPIRKLLLVGVGVLALYGVQACSSGTELNPQPLPPGPNEPPNAGSQKTGDPEDSTNPGGNGSSGSPTATPPKDAGPEGGDASDAGDG